MEGYIGTVAIAPWCEGSRHDLTEASDRELITGQLRCGCWVEGPAAARILKARELVRAAGETP